MTDKAAQLKADLQEEAAQAEHDLEQRIRGIGELATLLSDCHQHFILQGEDVCTVDFPRWAAWIEFHELDVIVAKTIVEPDIKVSTVFLAYGHSRFRPRPIMHFETMVFGGLLDEQVVRYSTIAEARAGHRAMVERVKRAEAGESL